MSAGKPSFHIKLYHGYGHQHNLVLYGHILKGETVRPRNYNSNILSNIIYLVKLFFLKPVVGVEVQLQWNNQQIKTSSEKDGFFKFEWQSDEAVPAGWHNVTVMANDEAGNNIEGEGKVFVPHITQYGFISDIDDTVMISYSATKLKRLIAVLTKGPHKRTAFADVARHYSLLAKAHTTIDVPNPFFYVSSSEWNLYNDLVEFFNYNKLPQGVFLLSQLKPWYGLIKTGKTKHSTKMIRIYRIMDAFPNQQFVLLGDNSQADPVMYDSIARKNPAQVAAIYIRNVYNGKTNATQQLLQSLQKDTGINCFLFEDNKKAIDHSIKIGLIDTNDL